MTVRPEQMTVAGWFVRCDVATCRQDLALVAGVNLTSTMEDAERLWSDAGGVSFVDGRAFCPGHQDRVSIEDVVTDAEARCRAKDRSRQPSPSSVIRRQALTQAVAS